MDVLTPSTTGGGATSPNFEETELPKLESISSKPGPNEMRQDLKDVIAKFQAHGYGMEGLYWGARKYHPTKPFYDFLNMKDADNLEAFPKSAFHHITHGPREFNFFSRVETVDMKLLESSFDARITIGLWYKATYEEVRMAILDEDFGRPQLGFVNAISDYSAVADQWTYDIIYFPKYGIWVKTDTLTAVQQTFQETFELQSFPFDVQDLNIKMCGPRVETCNIIPDKMKPTPISLNVSLFSETDWVYENAVCEFFNNEGQAQVHFHIKVSRRWQHYFYRIYSILTLCALSGVLTFSFEIGDDYTDAVGYMSTCVLTVVAFMFVVSSTLPPIPYLTFLDGLVFITLGFVFVLLFVLGLFQIEELGLTEKGVLTGSLITWAAIQVVFFIASVYLKRKEKKKLHMGTRELNELFEEKKDAFLSAEDCTIVPYVAQKPDAASQKAV